MEFAEGAIFAGYRIERRLGAGGSGAVFLARHPRLPRRDALKILSPGNEQDPHFRDRFLREAESAARLDHPNLVTIRDRGEENGRLWIAMQYVEGHDLGELIRRRAVDLERAVHILTEAARGLDEIHRAGLVHRDVKPANILVADQGSGPDRALITDFGVARRASEATADGRSGMSGTVAYAAPEQFTGAGSDHRADVYALGCTLYHLLTGYPPFPHDSFGAVMYAHVHEPPPRPSARNPEVPKGFDTIVAAAMAKSPGDRYDSCGELAAAARGVLAGGAAAVPRRRGRRGRRLAGVAAVTVAAAAVAWFLVAGQDRAAPAAAADHPARTGTTEPTEWGDFGFLAQAFPDLLPPTPRAAGYQDLSTCSSFAENEQLTQMRSTGKIMTISCQGDMDPVWIVQFVCRTDRAPIEPALPPAFAEGDEQWRRPSGSGRLFWGKYQAEGTGTLMDGKNAGVLDVYFDEPSRNFCRIQVIGDTPDGADLRRRWWVDAPI